MDDKKRSSAATKRGINIRVKAALIIVLVLLVLLSVRFAYLQLIDPSGYRVSALDQYTSSVTLTAKRGTIYASDGLTELAASKTVFNCFISPYDIETEEQLNDVADGLSAILSVDRDEILTKGKKTQSKYQVIKKYISDTEEYAVRAFIKEKGYSKIIALEETTKRSYSYGSLAAHVIGFTGTDNQGLAGIEYAYNSYLKGVDGKSVKAADAYGNKLDTGIGSTLIPATNGYNIVTTIDWAVQSSIEKYIRQAYEEHNPNGRVTCIVMDVENGEILGLGIYPSFDPNEYNKLSDEYQEKYEKFEGTDEERAKKYTELLYEMWNNTAVSQTYEPGSTFKIITSAMAIEENAVSLENSHFNCNGQIAVGGLIIHCHSKRGHGNQTFGEALVNSCNPAFVQIGTAVGQSTFKKYFEEFGYTKTSGCDMTGEVSSIYFGTYNSQFESVELAVYSFGQTFKVTPIQHLRAVSSIANGGKLVVPHVVKSLVDDKGNVVKSFDYEPDRQVVSESTCDSILKILTNSTKNASVSGYNIVSKTGTSEKRDTVDNLDDFISSCVSFAPAEDPKIAILVTVDEPTGSSHFGSAVAAPVVSKILTEILPHLGILPKQDEVRTVTLSDYRNSKVSDAKSVIERLGLKCVVKGDGSIVVDQMPRFDTVIEGDGVVILYTEGETPEADVKVPKLIGSTPTAAIKSLINSNLNVSITGIFNNDYKNCYVVAQSVQAGTYVAPGTVIELTFRYEESIE